MILLEGPGIRKGEATEMLVMLSDVQTNCGFTGALIHRCMTNFRRNIISIPDNSRTYKRSWVRSVVKLTLLKTALD
jgi:hypothetical protein